MTPLRHPRLDLLFAATPAVTRGLDPRVHRSSKEVLAKRMDCRVKPGNDGLAYTYRPACTLSAARSVSLRKLMTPIWLVR